MRKSVLDILVRATDRASTVIDSVAAKAGQSVDRVQKSMDAAGKRLSLAVSAPLALLGNSAIDAARDLGESINAVNVVFGAAAAKIHAFAKTSVDSVGLSSRAFNQLVTPIGAMLQNVGFGANQAAESSINLAKRAADMASVFNVDVSEALEAIQAGLRGEADPLERFGVGLSDAAVTARALELGLAGTAAELDANAKTQARLSLLMLQTDKIAGDWARTSGDLAGQERKAAAAAEEQAAAIGQKLIPIKQKLIGVLNSALSAWSGLSDSTQTTIVTFLGFAAAAGPVLIIGAKLISVVKAMHAAWLAFARIAPLIGAAIHTALGPIGAATAAITALAAGLLALNAVGKGIEGALDPSMAALRRLADASGLNVKRVVTDIHDLADELGVSAQTMERQVIATAERMGIGVDEALEHIRKWGAVTAESLVAEGNRYAAALNAMVGATQSSIDTAGQVVEEGAEVIAGKFGQIPERGADAMLEAQWRLEDATTQLVDFMAAALDPISEKAELEGFLASQELADALASNNPLVRQKAKEMADAAQARLEAIDGAVAGQKLMQTFARGIDGAAWNAIQATARAMAGVRGFLPGSEPKEGPLRGITRAFGFMETLAAGMDRGADAPVGVVGRVMGRVRDAMAGGLPGPQMGLMPAAAAVSAGTSIVGPLVHIEHFTGTQDEAERLARLIEQRIGRR